ncbi:MAG: lysozyme inhibitor LprI family protein [Pseudomonadota bacterium]
MSLLTAILFTLPTVTYGQNWDCSDYGFLPQQGMNYCAHQDYLAADAELNAVYQRVVAELKASEYGGRPDGKTEVDALRAAQRSWITFRDLACDMEGIHARGGTMERLLVSSCLADKTRTRTEDLKYLISVDGG